MMSIKFFYIVVNYDLPFPNDNLSFVFISFIILFRTFIYQPFKSLIYQSFKSQFFLNILKIIRFCRLVGCTFVYIYLSTSWSSFVGKLKKWDTVDEVHRTIDIPEAPKVGSSGKIRVDKSGIPLPPPPPPAHLLKQLHVANRNGKDADGNARAGGSPVSSFYSPGKKI